MTLAQVQAFFQTNDHAYGIFISLDEASQISGNTQGTLRKHVSEGRYDNSVLRGKPLRFARDKFCLDVANRSAGRSHRGASKPIGARPPKKGGA